MIKTTERIKKIAEFVNDKVVAEIGADHGYITKYLFDNKKINFAYLTDISKKSLDKAVKNFSKNYKDSVRFLVGDGLEVLDKNLKIKPNQIIIAGMGGKEIVNILSKNMDYSNFVLQPQKNILEVREFLIKNNYKILKDEVVKSGKMFYFVLKVKKSEKIQKLTKNQLEFGLTNLKNLSPDFISYLKFEQNKNSNILQNKFVKSIYKKQQQIEKLLVKGENLNVWGYFRISKIGWANFGS